MKALEIAAEIAKIFEGFKPNPYKCPAGVWTIGYGTTRYPDGRKVQSADPPVDISIAEEYLLDELHHSLLSTIKYCPVLVSNDNRLAAITDFVYNLGAGRLQTSTLRRRINQGDWFEVKRELGKWIRGGGRVLPGLVRRRIIESQLI
jgi:lysozyme